MRTVCKTVYQFHELSEQAQKKAIENYRANEVNTDYIYDEAYNTVKKFNEVFGLKEDRRSWLDFNAGHIDGNILNLKGQRLRTYIENNFGAHITKGKYFSLWSKSEVSFKHHKDGHPALKSRYSKVMFERNCALTGVCYDQSILQPMYEFLDWNLRPDYNSYMDFETLMNDCFASLAKDIEDEVAAQNSDEAIADTIESNGYEFDENGNWE